MLGHGLNDAVAGAHVVKQKIAVGMKLLATHGVRNREGAADDFCAGWSGGQRLNVTLVATDLVKEFRTLARLGSCRELGIAGGSFRSPYKAREVIDVGRAVGPSLVVGLGRTIAEVRDFIGLETAGDAHLI